MQHQKEAEINSKNEISLHMTETNSEPRDHKYQMIAKDNTSERGDRFIQAVLNSFLLLQAQGLEVVNGITSLELGWDCSAIKY